MASISIIAFIVIFIWLYRTSRKVTALEEQLQSLTTTQQPAVVPQEIPLAGAAELEVKAQNTSPSPLPIPIPAPTVGGHIPTPPSTPMPLYKDVAGLSQPAQPFFLYVWFREHTLIKVGSIIFFFGAAWFVSYAFEQNWIPPLMRVVMGLLIASLIYLVGFLRRPIEVSQYIVLTALGSAVVFATVLAAQFSFAQALLPAAVSLVLLLAAIGYTLWVAFETDTQWLAVTAVIASLLAPQFTGSDPASAVPFFSYLLIVSAGLGAVVLATAWRYVSLTLLLGVGMYLLSISSMPEQDTVVWFFAVLFSVLFLGLTTTSVLRNRVPLFIDGMTLLGTGLLFAYFVHIYAVVPALAAFTAAVVTGLIGYFARQQGADPSAVLLYASISIVSLFAGTAYLFDGFTATFFFAIESAALIFFAMRYAFLQRTILLAASTLLIPLVLGIEALAAEAWDLGIIHAPALAVWTVVLCFGSIGIYMYLTAERAALPWLHSVALATLYVWYGYTAMSLIVVGRSLATMTASDVLPWVLLLLLTLSVLITVVTFSRATARNHTLWTYALPVAAAVGVLLQSGIEDLFSVIDTIVLGVTLAVLIGITIAYGLVSRQTRLAEDALSSYIFLWMSFLFTTSWVMIFLGTVFNSALALTLSSVVVAMLSYGISNTLLRLAVRFDWITPFVSVLAVTTLGLLPAVSLRGWADGVLSVDAVSLYAYTTLVLLMGNTLYQYGTDRDLPKANTLATALFIIGGLFSFALVWVVTHTVSTTAVLAVTVALFIYTIVGLLAYVYGKRTAKEMFVRAGYLLLAAVVLRLALIDVWAMDPFWRIVTFLGIGALFIVAALLERKPGVRAEE